MKKKTKKRVKLNMETINNIAMIIIIGALIIVGYVKLNDYNKEQHAKEVQEYRTCIEKQSEKQGWIIRSYCSLNYDILDKEAGLEYEQVGKDLYLKK